jgi:hypothetical protein
VVFEYFTVSDEIAKKPAVVEFASAVCRCLIRDGDWQSELGLDCKKLQRRFGSKIELGRIERLNVQNGATAVASLAQSRSLAPRPRGVKRTETAVTAVAAVAVEAARDAGERGTLCDIAEALASELLTMGCDSEPASGKSDTFVRELLLMRRFGGDPSLSVREVLELLSGILGVEVTIAAAARLVRREFEPSDPGNFPGEQAMRA